MTAADRWTENRRTIRSGRGETFVLGQIERIVSPNPRGHYIYAIWLRRGDYWVNPGIMEVDEFRAAALVRELARQPYDAIQRWGGER